MRPNILLRARTFVHHKYQFFVHHKYQVLQGKLDDKTIQISEVALPWYDVENK